MKKPSSKRRYFLILLAIIIVGFILKSIFFKAEVHPNYITSPVTRGNIELTVLADGNIQAYKMVNVGAQVSGQIKVLHVALGDKVVKGQLVAEIDDLTQQNYLKENEATLKNLQAQKASREANLKNSQAKFERQRRLLNRRATARADYDVALAELEANLADIDALSAQIVKAQIALDTSKLNLGYTKINSPIDGVVVAIPVEEGQTVNAVQSAPTIIKVAQLDTMTIKAKISEADVTKVSAGMPVYFTILAEPNKRYSAMLRTIEPAPTSINTDTTNTSNNNVAIFYNGLFDIPNPDNKLQISMTAQVYIVLKQAQNAIIVPSSALSNMNNSKADVQVLDSANNVTTKQVEVGINNNIHAQILSGLSEGEHVIISESYQNAMNGEQHQMSMRM